ncbi:MULTISPECIES: ATP-dependent Clp protease proteolytic subunit [Blastopirellula]|uniref:ATP-dependent Clp protease proteolytic subunit n=1 Tax=Blastopirellula marina DSM 3645 TaxID=314230 RepID=A4A306_9BACT|nr:MULTISPECIES: ATP-dependent Clp protease proteolytic subunit [Blastopirellula]EAQ76852.1 hypothetical protein DSM3645_05869 [Blastopirellula marina DSM 3645]UUO05388.1 ATP-dependent Clp protease proteolytic subunit [Blastopirellula sp. J2-11]
MNHDEEDDQEPEKYEIAISGELGEDMSELYEKLIAVPEGGECTLYFDSPGGSSYAASALVSLIKLRRLKATGIVIGECSSAAIWPFAACYQRYVTRWSVLLFHPMRWQSEENIPLAEAREWVRHYKFLHEEMDVLLANLFGADEELINRWTHPGKFVIGPELAEAGLAELIEL